MILRIRMREVSVMAGAAPMSASAHRSRPPRESALQRRGGKRRSRCAAARWRPCLRDAARNPTLARRSDTAITRVFQRPRLIGRATAADRVLAGRLGHLPHWRGFSSASSRTTGPWPSKAWSVSACSIKPSIARIDCQAASSSVWPSRAPVQRPRALPCSRGQKSYFGRETR